MADRTALGVGVLTAAATLAGAGLGVVGTLLVSNQQQRAAEEAELRIVRAEAYDAYLAAARDMFLTQMEYATGDEDNCAMRLSEVGPVAEDQDLCAIFSLDRLKPVERAVEDARRDVLIYGSPDGIQAVRALSDYLAFSGDVLTRPFSDAVTEVWVAFELEGADEADAAWEAAWDGYEAHEAELLLVMCGEVSVTSGDCGDFATEAGAPRPSASPAP